ncbi:MAG TPA: branched-chain amino acid ABC transporter substrate-binding protein [Actinomycetota bacterium]|nr:branched-chain amino acid ABC transporter substrate-binding protein [Actinomycetota bacterium]
MRKGVIAAALAVLAAAAVVSAAVANTAGPAVPAQLAQCTNVSLGFLGPLTGPAAFLGQEQFSWLQFGVQKYNKENGTRFKTVQGDTQLKAPVARTAARRLASNRNIMAIVGGSESQAVRVSGKLFANARLVSISGSATAVDLTKGRPYKTFFRVVPNDGIQGPTIVRYVSGVLKARNVVVIDSQDDYSLPLAQAITRGLRAAKVTVSRQSVSADDTDFSSVVANISSNIQVVVFATQVATAANTLSNQLREQGKRAIVFGSDGAYAPTQFKPRSGYVSVFAPDIQFDRKARALINEYKRWSKNKPFGAFGPATYLAGLVAMNAIKNACADGRATRAEVVKQTQRTNIPSIYGGTVRFSRAGDPLPTKFVIYRITNGKYSPVG